MGSLFEASQERSLLRWGGLAGLLGGALLLFVFIFVGAVIGPEPAGLEGPVSRFPEIAAARTFENTVYLVVMALLAIHVATLAYALRGASLAPALVGGVLGVAGTTVLAAGALPHVATGRLSDLYHAAGATPADQATVAFVWQANQGIFDALLAAGLVPLSIGVAALGLAMLGAPAFGRRLGAATIALGLAGTGAATAFVLDPRSPMIVIGFLALVVFGLVLGWRVYRLSNAPGAARGTLAELRVADGRLSSYQVDIAADQGARSA